MILSNINLMQAKIDGISNMKADTKEHTKAFKMTPIPYDTMKYKTCIFYLFLIWCFAVFQPKGLVVHKVTVQEPNL